MLPYYLSFCSTGQEIFDTVQGETLLLCFFRAQETNEVNSVAQHQESCIHQLRKKRFKSLHTELVITGIMGDYQQMSYVSSREDVKAPFTGKHHHHHSYAALSDHC